MSFSQKISGRERATNKWWSSAATMLAATLVLSVPAAAQSPEVESEYEGQASSDRSNSSEATDSVIVKYEKGVDSVEQDAVLREEGVDKEKNLDLINADAVEVADQQVEEAIEILEANPEVEYAEPDRVVRPLVYRDEPRFRELWGLHNTGQKIMNRTGKPNVDINALQASNTTQSRKPVVVAVLDDGVDFAHPDLADRAWNNPDEVPGNGEDDDKNGYVDDTNGWNFHQNNNKVHKHQQDFHGTHVAGTIAASANGRGVVGVAPNVKIMAVKWLGPSGSRISRAIKAIEYAKKEGAKISNNSWGYEGRPSRALEEAIQSSEMLFVAAAGNGGRDRKGDDNDTNPNNTIYPSSYSLPNILSVAAIDNRGELARFSNYGIKSVDLAAPGMNILSTFPENEYGYLSGTSMATPHAVGTAALVASKSPHKLNRPTSLKKAIMKNGRSLASVRGKTVTGDLVDAKAAVKDTTTVQARRCTIKGTKSADILIGTVRQDVICGLEGNDIIRGSGGNDIIYGDTGNDILNGDSGRDRIISGAGKDVVRGGVGKDRLYGGSNRDVLNTREGRGGDLANGGSGRDVCSADPKDKVLRCP